MIRICYCADLVIETWDEILVLSKLASNIGTIGANFKYLSMPTMMIFEMTFEYFLENNYNCDPVFVLQIFKNSTAHIMDSINEIPTGHLR